MVMLFTRPAPSLYTPEDLQTYSRAIPWLSSMFHGQTWFIPFAFLGTIGLLMIVFFLSSFQEVKNMRGVLEKIYTVLDTIGNFFSWIFTGLTFVSDWLSVHWSGAIGLFSAVPPVASLAVALVVCIALIYLILGR